MLILDQPLELGEAFERDFKLRARIRTAESLDHCLSVIRVLVFEIDFGVERSGEIGRQIARILRADGNTGAEGPAFAGEVLKMGAFGHAPRLVQHEQARELAGLRAAYQHAMQPDNDKFCQRRLDFVRGQREQRQHQPPVEHSLERYGQLAALREQPQLEQGRKPVQDAGSLRILLRLPLFENGNHVIEAWRPDGARIHPLLRIDATPLESLLHGLPQNRCLAVAEIEHALQNTCESENMLHRLSLPIPTSAGHQRVKRNAVPAHIVDTKPDILREIRRRIIVLEIENANRQAHPGHAIDQHIQSLRFAGTRIAGNEHTEV